MRNFKILSVYSAGHFVVDMLSSFIMLGILTKYRVDDTSLAFFSVLLYNFCAFALQFPLGILSDKLNKNGLVSTMGMLFSTLALIISPLVSEFLILIPSVLVGIGNALYHLGGGIDVLNISEGKATLPGVYVATGAMGLFLGGVFAYTNISFIIMIAIGVITTSLLYWVYKQAKNVYKINNEEFKFECNSEVLAKVLYFMFFAVCLRSFAGYAIGFDWKTGVLIGIITTICVMLGKMFGGIIGDRIGWKKISMISLTVSSILFYFAPTNMYCGLVALFLFNMTMPLTLSSLSNSFPNSKGTMFGLTTLALFLGYFVSLLFGGSFIESVSLYLGINNIGGIILLICSVLSLFVMVKGLGYYEKVGKKKKEDK